MRNFEKTAWEAASAAGKILLDNIPRVKKIGYKGKHNIVTNVDHLSQKKILSIIAKNYPSHAILAEEKGGKIAGKSDYRWLIDPLDGTTNYAHGYPFFAVSIALEYRHKIILGLVYAPVLGEVFMAEEKKGAYLNGRKIKTSKTKNLSSGLLATGFPYDSGKRLNRHLRQFKDFLSVCHGVRRDGSAALNLSYLAAGRLDGFWEINLSPWDTAAGSLLVSEGGGTLSDFSGNPFHNYGKETLASNGFVHKAMLKIVKKK